MDPKAGDFQVDLECGMPVNQGDSITSPLENVKNQAKSLLAKFSGAKVEESSGGLTEHLLSSSLENEKSVTANGVESVNDGDKKVGKENRKKTNNKKAAKPPRPPKGPSLDAADQKLIREIKQMAMLKRARIERLRALKKMKSTKQSSSSSSSSNVIGSLLTVIFFIVILLQGMSSRSTTQSSSQGSPFTLQAEEARLVSIQFSGNPSASHPNNLIHESPKSLAPIPKQDLEDSQDETELHLPVWLPVLATYKVKGH
ncbi:hypothetical protein ACFE04_005867 [Oxalis oulophora]